MKSFALLLIFSLISCSKENSPNPNISQEESEIVRSYDAKAVTPTAPSNPVIYPSVTNDKNHAIALTIRNSSTEGESLMNTTSLNFESLTLTSNGCPSTGLKPKSSCTIRFSYAAKDKAEGIYSGSVTIDGLEIQMQIPVIPAVVDSTVDVVPTPLSVDFGSLTQTSSTVTKSISYRNKLSKSITGEAVTFENNPSDFTIISNSCNNVSAKGTCSVRLSLNPKGKNGTLENALLFAGSRVPLSAQVEGNPPPPVLVENILSNVEIVDFGDIQPNSTSNAQSVVFTNKSNIAINLPTVLVNNSFKILSDNCSNRQIAVNSNCTVRLVFSSVGQNVAGPQTGTLSLGSKTVSLQANILSEEELADLFDQNAVNSNIVIEYLSVRYTHMTNPPELPSPYIDLGTKNQGDTLSLNITVRNIGTAPARITSSSFASNISIVSNSCSLLNPNTSCSLRGNLNSQTMANLDLRLVMTHETLIFPIRYTLTLPNSLCTNDNALNNGVTDMNGVVSVSGNLPNCVVASCNETLFEIAPDQKSCVLKSVDCTVSDVQNNGWNTLNYLTLSGQKTGSNISQCNVSSCEPSYNLNILTKSCDPEPVITYQAIETTPSCSSLNLQPCDGSQSISRSYTCQKLIDGVVDNTYISNPNDCSISNSSPLLCDSPSGVQQESINGGSIVYTCSVGQTIENSTQSLICDPDFSPNTTLNICEENLPLQVSQIADLNPGLNDNPSALKMFNNELYFSAAINSSNHRKMFKMKNDGTVVQVTNLNPTGSDLASPLIIYNNELFFISNNSSGFSKLFKLDSLGNIAQVSNTTPTGNDSIGGAVIFNNNLYISSSNSSGFSKVYRYIAPLNFQIISNTNPMGGDFPNLLSSFIFNGELFFSSRINSVDFKLFKINSSNQVSQVSNSSSANDSPGFLGQLNGHAYLFLNTTSSSVAKIFRLETNGLLYQASNINPAGTDRVATSRAIIFNNNMYFTAQSGTANNTSKIFKMNSSGVISQVSNTNPTGSDVVGIGAFFIYNGEIYFDSRDGATNFQKLYKITNNDSVTQVSNINLAGNDFASPHPLYAILNNKLYFTSNNASGLNKLFEFDASGSIQVSNVFPGGTDDIGTSGVFLQDGNNLFFSARINSSGHRKLFKYGN